MKNRSLGITLRIALLSWLVAIVTLLIFVTAIIPQQKRTFLENLESKAHGVAVSLRDVAAGAAVNEDYSSVVDHCKGMLDGDPALNYLVITKNDGFSLINDRTGWRSEPNASREWRPAKRVPGSGIGFVPLVNRRVFHYSQPFDYSGIQWGWIHVGLSLESYDRSVAIVYQRTSVLAILCILLSLVASTVYARRLVRPILHLRRIVEQVAGGDLSVRAAVESGDELGSLASSVNSMTEALLRRDQILESVRFAAQQFLSTNDWKAVIHAVLAKIGGAAHVSRVYVFENLRLATGEAASVHRFEWCAAGVSAQIANPELQRFRWTGTPLEDWAHQFTRGETVVVRVQSSAPAEREFLQARQAQSLMLIPIRVENQWWGFLGLDECGYDRAWTDAEGNSIRAAADMFSAAIERQRAQDALLEAKESLEQRVLERTRQLQEQVAAKEKAHADLAEAQQSLVAASHEAGMAEVATGVLHNVGNVLNSVNVSATLIREQLRQSEVSTLRNLRGLLQQHAGDLDAFLTTDPKGKLVPGLVIELSEHLEREQTALQAEHEQLARNVEHIKEIVAMQQSYARVSGFTEQVSIAELLDDALEMDTASLTRHGIEVVRDYAAVPKVTADKHKVLQILINLVHNAKYALDNSRRPDKRLTVGIGMEAADHVKVTVADNGIGIPPENLTRVFSHGFTTRKGGHGFGLHSGANAAKEMGGQLKIHSDGVGRGAIFTLELPLTVQRNEPRTEP